MNKKIKINNEIKSQKIRVTNDNRENLGILNIKEALKLAKKKKLDLVEIVPQANPPVCKITNYGKYIYKKNKILKKNKKKKVSLKEVKFRLNTNKNDFLIKLKNIIRFILKGNKVKIIIIFRGREIIHQNIANKILDEIKDKTKNISNIELNPNKIENRQMIMILSSRTK